MLLTLSLLLACSTEIDNKPAAQVTQPTTKQVVAPPPQLAGNALPLKADSSSIGFVGAKITGSHDGGFKTFQGGLVVEQGKPVSTQVTVDMASLFADKAKLTKHLKSPDFFDVGALTKGSFTSTSIVETDGGYSITGNLDFHGKSNEITFPATITLGDGTATAKAEFTIDRHLWGVSYPGKKDDLIKDNVLIKLDLNFGD
jgi:polyisoprenoid-binding protein YceI